MAYARLHLSGTLLVLAVALVVPATSESEGGALLPVALGYIAVQVACAAHVVLVRLRETRSGGAQSGTTSTAAP